MSVTITHNTGFFSCCSLWIMLYRGNNENVYQNLKGNWC
jgi:hypothetical protein